MNRVAMLTRGKAREWIFLLVLVVLTICVYSNTLDGEFVFDDSRIYNSPSVRLETFSPAAIVHAVRTMEPASRPVANLTFILNYYFAGFAVRAYHLTNLVIHLCSGILLYFFLKATFALPRLREKYPSADLLAFGVALVWMVHPLQTQAVSYIVQRMTSLAAMFSLLSLLLYVRGRSAASFDKRFLLFSGAALSALLALGSKETAVTLPLFIFLYEWFFFQDLRREWLRQNAFYVAVVLVFLLAVPWLLVGTDLWQVITSGYAVRDFTLVQRVLTEFRVLFLYLGLIVFPWPGRLSLEHDFVVSTSLFTPVDTVFAVAGVVMLIGGALWLAPRYRLPSFCILWFFGNHAVESSILPLELVFEHRNYLPSAMVICLLVLGARYVLRNRYGKGLFLCGIVLLLSWWTYERNGVWQNGISLWSDTAQKAPHLLRPLNALGVFYQNGGMEEAAEAAFHSALAVDSESIPVLVNLFFLYARIGRQQEADEMLERAKDVVSHGHFARQKVCNGNDKKAVEQLAKFLDDQGRYREAIVLLEGLSTCIKNSPEYFAVLGLCYARAGDYLQSAGNYERAVQEDPENPRYLFSLARSYILAGKKDSARQVFRKLSALPIPDDLQPFVEQQRRILASGQ